MASVEGLLLLHAKDDSGRSAKNDEESDDDVHAVYFTSLRVDDKLSGMGNHRSCRRVVLGACPSGGNGQVDLLVSRG